jgi:hypothetical protein
VETAIREFFTLQLYRSFMVYIEKFCLPFRDPSRSSHLVWLDRKSYWPPVCAECVPSSNDHVKQF